MIDPTHVVVGVVIVACGMAVATVVGLRFNAQERRLDDTIQARHRAFTADPVIYTEPLPGVFVVVQAPERATVDAELVKRAKLGSTPDLVYMAATARGELLLFGSHDQGQGKVTYALGGLDPERRCYDAVRVV